MCQMSEVCTADDWTMSDSQMIYMFVDDRWVQASADERHDSVLVLHRVSHVTTTVTQYNKS